MLKVNYEGQMQAYVHWVNAQLKKRPGSRFVDELERDMRDGVAFLQLIEVIGDENVNMIEDPKNVSEMSSNVTRVLRFMAERKIKMHQINTKEIVGGNLKAIMRLILALAAHFKPGSVRQTSSIDSPMPEKLERASSTMSLAAEAAAALADASQMASSAGLSLHYKYRSRPNFDMQTFSSSELGTFPRTPVSRNSRSTSPSSNASSSHHSAGGKARGDSLTRQNPKNMRGSANSTPTRDRSRKSSVEHSRSPSDDRQRDSKHDYKQWRGSKHTSHQLQFGDDLQPYNVAKKVLGGSKSDQSFSRSRSRSSKSSRASSPNSTTSFDDQLLAEEHDDMVTDVKTLKDQLLELQQLILAGDATEDNNNGENIIGKMLTHALCLEGGPAEEQVVIYKARLDQAHKDYEILQKNHSSIKEEIIKLQGEKVGLQDRLTQLEKALIDLRSGNLRQELACDSARSAKQSAQRIIDERERQIASLHVDVARKDHMIRNQNREIEQLLATLAGRDNTEADRDTELNRRDLLNSGLQCQIHEITERLEELDDSESQIHSQMDNYSRRLTKYEQTIARTLSLGETREEYQRSSSTYENLRMSFAHNHHPRQHAFDDVEKDLNKFLRTVTHDDMALKSSTQSAGLTRNSAHRLSARERRGDDEDIFVHNPKEALEKAMSRKTLKKTKVLYFRNHSITPYLGILDKRLGEAKLKDFKKMLDRPGNFRYFFKAVDPDFGGVRKEVTSDNHVIPGWEDKIIAWVEEDKESSLASHYDHHHHHNQLHHQPHKLSKSPHRHHVNGGAEEDLV